MEWVTRENIKRFERLLEAERDPVEAARLEALLTEETKKLHNLQSQGNHAVKTAPMAARAGKEPRAA